MANVNDLEKTVGEWYKKANLPHLPKAGQTWLAENIWWLALIGAIISVIGLLAIVPLFLAAIAVTGLATTATLGYAATYTAGFTGLYWLSALLGMVSYIVTTVLLVAAINPLKAKAKKGWTLLFLSYLISFALGVVGDVISLNFLGILTTAIGAAISGYFLYEIHSYFGAKHKEAHHVKAEKK